MNRAKSLNSSNVGEKMGMCLMLGVGWLSRPVAPLFASIRVTVPAWAVRFIHYLAGSSEKSRAISEVKSESL